MAAYQGYLIKLGDVIFPLKYIVSTTYKSNDNQRTENKAYRDANNLLHRQTSRNHKTKIEFETPTLYLNELEEIKSIVDKALIDRVERKMNITYWNSEEMKYKKATVYMPDPEYIIKSASKDNLIYNGVRMAFIQY